MSRGSLISLIGLATALSGCFVVSRERGASTPDAGAPDASVPDGGVSFVACEKQLGICAGSRGPSDDGGPGAACASSSYGPNYAEEDLLCDGLDNDCDGEVDEGLRVELGSGPVGHFYWSTAGRYVALAVESADGGAAVRFLDGEHLTPSFEVPLPTPRALGEGRLQLSPALDSVLVAAFPLPLTGGTRPAEFIRIGVDGGLLFGDGGAIAQESGGSWSARATISRDGSCVLLAWDDFCRGSIWTAMTVDLEGRVIAPPTSVVSDPSAPCGPGTPAKWIALSGGRFGLSPGAVAKPQDGGILSIPLPTFDCQLRDAGLERYTLEGSTAPANRLLWVQIEDLGGNGVEDLWAYETDSFDPAVQTLAWRLVDPVPLRIGPGSFAPRWTWVELERGSSGPFVLQIAASHPEYRTHRSQLDGGQLLDLGESNSPSRPLALDLGNDMFITGGEIHDGGRAHRWAQFFCAPR